MPAKIPYRPEIDGLRAIAVMAVVFYHAGLGFHGGYVGVDVFFVISGFLITSLILNDIETGIFSLARFWERRARRIIPALVVITIIVLIVGWSLLLPADYEELGWASVAQSGFAANFYYWWTSGYFGGPAAEMPLIHVWSLAIEEQFYLMFPFLLWGLYAGSASRMRNRVVPVFASLFLVSLVLSIYGVWAYPTATFYLLPTRAWELLLGALVSLLPLRWDQSHRPFPRELLSVAGALMILGSMFIYSQKTPFPGLAALPPCVGTALIIWANSRSSSDIPTRIGSILAASPLVFIGLASYSLYLWHWPFLAFANYLTVGTVPKGYRAILAVLGILLGLLSWKFVETPFRERKLAASRRSMFAFAAIGLIGAFSVGLSCVVMHGFRERLPDKALEFADAASDSYSATTFTTEDIGPVKLLQIGRVDSGARPELLVWGDSQAAAALPAIDDYLKERGIAGRAAISPGTAPVLDWFSTEMDGLKEEAPPYEDAVFDYVRSHHIPNVILVAYWEGYARGTFSAPFSHALVSTVRRLSAVGSHTWILFDPPVPSFNVPRMLARAVIDQTDPATFCVRPTASDRYDQIDPAAVEEIKSLGGTLIDPKPAFLDPSGQYYIVEANGVALYRDRGHLTMRGARVMLLPVLRQGLALQIRK